MPLPAPAAERERLHLRQIHVEGFRRADGLWDIEAHMRDTKDDDYPVIFRTIPTGESLHDMWLRVTVDDSMTIVDVIAVMDAAPVDDQCRRIEPDYKKLIGLRFAPGFRDRANQRMGGVKGCTHLSEMLGPIATVAFQTLSAHKAAHDSNQGRPYLLDGCHTWNTRNELVRQVFPQWYRKPEGDQDADQ